MINKLIMDTLKPLNIPVRQHHYGDSANTYITFFEINQRGEEHADNEEISTRYSIQVDVISTGELDDLVKRVKDLMKAQGFIRKSEMALYNQSTKKFRKLISFQIVL